MRPHHWFRGVLGVVLLTGMVAFFARPAAGATPEQVDQAIKRAVQYIYSQQKGDNWELVPKANFQAQGGQSDVTGKQWGGVTAAAVYGLLAAGENPQDPRVAKGIDWLMRNEIIGTYAAGLRAQVWTLIPENSSFKNRLRAAVQRDFQFFARTIHDPTNPKYKYLNKDNKNNGNANLANRNNLDALFADPRAGFYAYHYDPKAGGPLEYHYDRSVSQYGVLGMWACEQAGAEVPTDYWRVVDYAWKKAQQPDGGWNYDANREVSATMTAAGVATLFITQDYLLGDMGPCRGNVTNPQLDKGLAWMDRNIAGVVKGGGNYFYLMYGIERIGVASGRKFFGTFDWYEGGAEEVLKKQNKDGSFGGDDPHGNPRKVPDTVFATLFLVRGRAPVIMNKLEYATTAPGDNVEKRLVRGGSSTSFAWNQRPRDVANFTHWMSRQAERPYNWQVVNLKVAPEELLDSPILYIAGSEPLVLKPEEEAKLKAYIEAGGIVLANADCAKERFTRSIIQLGQKLFPYEFRPLEANHPIYTREQFNLNQPRGGGSSGKRPQVQGLSNGVRELMLVIPTEDAGRWWQARADRNREEAFQLGANIFLYSVEKQNARYKGETFVVLPKKDAKPPTRSLGVARLQVPGNWDPEPGGWRRVGQLLANDYDLGVTVKPVKLDEGGQLAGSGAKLAHLTGTSKLALNEVQRRELRDFVKAGGTLLVDAAGGSIDFAESAERELIATFGDAIIKQLTTNAPLDHALFRQGKNATIAEIGYRLYGKPTLTGRQPRLKALEIDGRPAVFFSREDLSAGMVGQPVDGILGYDPASATAIVRNLALFVANGGKAAPATQPTTKPAASPVAEAQPAKK